MPGSKHKLLHIVGNRPQFIKLSALLRVMRLEEFEHVLVHSGQHYDYNMSKVFFDELGIPAPKYFLNVGSGSHDAQTARILIGLDPLWAIERPDTAIVYGDTNTTMAGALSAYKCNVPLAHVEAGYREYEWRPEEINKVVSDHCATYCFCPIERAAANVKKENIPDRCIYLTGDITYDSFLWAMKRIGTFAPATVPDQDSILLTLHRAETVDRREVLEPIVDSVTGIDRTVYFPVHPRTRRRLVEFGLLAKLADHRHLQLMEPLGYFEFLAHLRACATVLTDSGGVTKEAYYAGKPTAIMDTRTEYIEVLEEGRAFIAGDCRSDIEAAIGKAIALPQFRPSGIFGDGNAATRIMEILRCSTPTRKS